APEIYPATASTKSPCSRDWRRQPAEIAWAAELRPLRFQRAKDWTAAPGDCVRHRQEPRCLLWRTDAESLLPLSPACSAARHWARATHLVPPPREWRRTPSCPGIASCSDYRN